MVFITTHQWDSVQRNDKRGQSMTTNPEREPLLMRSRRESFYIYARVAFWNWHARAKFLLIRWGKVTASMAVSAFRGCGCHSRTQCRLPTAVSRAKRGDDLKWRGFNVEVCGLNPARMDKLGCCVTRNPATGLTESRA